MNRFQAADYWPAEVQQLNSFKPWWYLAAASLLVSTAIALARTVGARDAGAWLPGERWPMLAFEGVLGVLVGLLSILYPGLAVLAWLYVIAAWAIVTGVLEIVLAIRLRTIISGEIWVALTGLLSIIFGIAIAAVPRAGLLVWAWLIGAYAIAFGILLIALAFRLRKMGASASPTGLTHAGGV